MKNLLNLALYIYELVMVLIGYSVGSMMQGSRVWEQAQPSEEESIY